MSMPRWIAQVYKQVFNRLVLKRGRRPTIKHIGRHSGKEYETPVDAIATEYGYVFFLLFGTRSDWVRNILAHGGAVLAFGGKTYDLVAPRVVDSAANGLPKGTRRLKSIVSCDCLLVQVRPDEGLDPITQQVDEEYRRVPSIGVGRRWYDYPYRFLDWFLSGWRRDLVPRRVRGAFTLPPTT